MPKRRKNRFEKRLENLAVSTIIKIAHIDQLKGQWISGVRLSPQFLGRLKKTTLITSTGASTRIEGAKLSDGMIEKLIDGIKISSFKERDGQEVKGYYELLKIVHEKWKHIVFSENSIKHFHKELLKYVEKDIRHRGEYKNLPNSVVATNENGQVIGTIFATTQPYLTPKEMQELTDWTKENINKKTIHPLLIIGNWIVEFLKIHPFQDGNGRLSRIITNLLLLQHGYEYVQYVSNEKIIEERKKDYYLSLRSSQKTMNTKNETIEIWLNFFLDLILEQSKKAIELLNQENIETLLSPHQRKIWNCFLEKKELSAGELSRKTSIARPTINQGILKLLHLKKIIRIGEGRATRYRRAEN